MLGTAALTRASSSSANSRVFVYEVTGLRQNDVTEQNQYQFRHSDSVFIQVPYERMNDEMRRITRLGGKIVSIKPLNQANASDAKADSE